jgi:PST family polysaccharide transporter
MSDSFTQPPRPTAPASTNSYLQILRSTALIGFSSLIVLIFSMVRMKALALLLGPAGIGLIGLYSSVMDLTSAIAGMGVQSSGVRQIAEASGTGDSRRIASTVAAVKWTSLGLGVAGAICLAALCVPVSMLTFGTTQHAMAIALLGLAVFIRTVSGGQSALIQGLCRISDLARINILGALAGTVISIPLIYYFGEPAIVPSLILTSVAALAASWWYQRKIVLEVARFTPGEVRTEAGALLRLGFVFMISGFLTMGAAYAIRIIMLHQAGVAAAGLYQAAWGLGGLYSAFVLQAMGADFYPRLTAIAKDDAACNRMVNEQARISILLAGPGVIGTITLAHLVLTVFYSSEFAEADTLLRWICLGMMLRVVAWPMGFIVLAKGAQWAFFWTEVAATIVHVGLVALLVPMIGVNGAGVAFFGLYVWHSIIIYFVVRSLSGFRYAPDSLRLSLIYLPLTGAAFCSFLVLPFWPAIAFGLVLSAASSLYSLHAIVALLSIEAMPAALRPLLYRLMGRAGSPLDSKAGQAR